MIGLLKRLYSIPFPLWIFLLYAATRSRVYLFFATITGLIYVTRFVKALFTCISFKEFSHTFEIANVSISHKWAKETDYKLKRDITKKTLHEKPPLETQPFRLGMFLALMQSATVFAMCYLFGYILTGIWMAMILCANLFLMTVEVCDFRIVATISLSDHTFDIIISRQHGFLFDEIKSIENNNDEEKKEVIDTSLQQEALIKECLQKMNALNK